MVTDEMSDEAFAKAVFDGFDLYLVQWVAEGQDVPITAVHIDYPHYESYGLLWWQAMDITEEALNG